MLKSIGVTTGVLFLVSGIIGCSSSSAESTMSTVSENVSWAIGETTVTATITRPDSSGAHPAVVFIAGSGPTDRDWNSPLIPGGNGSARLIAEELAKAGFVTIRYDKRVTGPYAQENIGPLTGKISMDSHREEVAGAVGQLLSRSDVDPARIYVLANSEGNIHALNYQLQNQPEFAGLVLLAPPGRPMTEVFRGQTAAQVAALPNAAAIMAGYDTLMADFLAARPFVANADVPEVINTYFQGFNLPVNLPFGRELFNTQPASLLSQVTAPTLVVIGQKDVQVDWQLDGQVLEAAAANNKNISFSYPENANHVLKYEPRPVTELSGADALAYNEADKILDADGLNVIIEWLKGQAGLN